MSDERDTCGICGELGADKMALWTGGGVYWPGEFVPETEYVHQECEQEENRRAHAELPQDHRDDVLRAISGGGWPCKLEAKIKEGDQYAS